VRVAVVEVGIGGRLDATNVLSPEVSVVTNVAADHLDVLGPTVEDVAREKAGIFRRGQPALVGAEGTAPGPLAVLHAEARRTGARLVEIPPAARWDGLSPLAGAHQRANVALAVAAARAVAPLDDAAIESGLRATRWRARLERIEAPGRRPLLVDGAHNPAGALALSAHLDAAGLSGNVDLLFGGMADKDLPAVFAPLAARARRIVLASLASPRAESAERLADRLDRPELETAASVEKGLALLESAGGETPILVAGSLYLAGEVLALRSEGRAPSGR
jgi:dihydrofolate synthase/folylpolyglutamate synthase